ncbi:MAG: hypothetical protein R3250_07600 [Melioribacteraceae bacterium]|nr:hypothetical protein [Melioribacteraceae bacterium]
MLADSLRSYFDIVIVKQSRLIQKDLIINFNLDKAESVMICANISYYQPEEEQTEYEPIVFEEVFFNIDKLYIKQENEAFYWHVTFHHNRVIELYYDDLYEEFKKLQNDYV